MAGILLLWLELIRFGRRLVRRVVGTPPPSWFDDLTDSLHQVNILQFVPTVIAIAFAPRHLFRRIEEIQANRKRLYKSPLKFAIHFLSTTATLILVLQNHFALVRSLTGKLPFDLKHCVLLTAIAVPVWIPLFSGAVWIISWVILATPLAAIIPINRLAIRVPLSIATYRNLNWKRYCWSLFYFGIYSFAPLLLILLFASGLGRFIAHTGPDDASGMQSQLTGVLVMFVLTAYAFLVLPYVELLRGCCQYPTVLMYRSDLYQLKAAIEQYLDQTKRSRKKGRARQVRKSVTDPNSATVTMEDLIDEWTEARARLQVQECDVRRKARPELYDDNLAARAAAFRHLPLEKFRTSLCELAVETEEELRPLWSILLEIGKLQLPMPIVGAAENASLAAVTPIEDSAS